MSHSLRRVFASVRAVVASLIVTGLLAGFAAPALAIGGTNGTINGTVTDQVTRAPLAGVSVTAASPSQTARTLTDSKGFYNFTGLPIDTYTLAFSYSGYEVNTATGVTVQGDGTVTVDAPLNKTLRTIGRATARTQSQAFQPKQTTDSYQVTGQQQSNALGKAFNTSQSQLQSSVPGIQQTVYGSSSIRGSTRTELAYQLDGINYTDPATSQFQNSLGINGLQSLQVNPGAGDATQGNAGAGAVNIVIRRGSTPAFGTLDVEAIAYPYTHQLGLEYGWATPNGRFSNYSSFTGINQDRIYGGSQVAAIFSGSVFGTERVNTRDVINNMVFKFGHDNSRSLQFLYQSRYSWFFIGRNSYNLYNYKSNDASALANYATLLPGVTAASRNGEIQGLIPLLPFQPSATSPLVYQNEQYQPVDVLKFQYDQTLDANTYWANRLYKVIGTVRFDTPYTASGVRDAITLGQGGNRTGFSGDLIHTFGQKHQVSLSYLYEFDQPVFDQDNPGTALRSLGGAAGVGYELADFIPSNIGAGLCPTSDPSGNALKVNAATGSACGYIANQFGGGIQQIPNLRAQSAGSSQLYGVGIRDVFSASKNLRLDFGVRLDGSNVQLANEYPAQGTGNETKHPTVFEPRFAFSYQLGNNDAIRASYGRSAQFVPGAIINTPVASYGQLAGIPSRDSRTGLPAMYCVAPKFTSQCANYAQQVHDEMIQLYGLESNKTTPATYNNYDASYSHQFGGNVGLKITPFFKRGYNVNVFATPVIGADVNTGLPIFGAATLSNLGLDKSTGAEFYLTKESQYGISGFLDLTYVNRLQNVPPGYGGQTEDFYPSIPPVSIQLGQLYRAGYLSPLTGRLGVAYKSRSGFRVNPIISYDRGFPIGAGTLAAAIVNNVAMVLPNTNASVVGSGAIANSGTNLVVSQYISPTNPGSVLNPNIAATRGTAETPLAGGILSRPRVFTDLAIEYQKPGSRVTLGAYVANLFNNVYSEPGLNSRWQPVATGIGGPQTGQTASTQTLGPLYGFYNFGPERYGRNAYNLAPSSQPLTVRGYMQIAL